jgi:tetratricopeptide (TPR) repeat protein
MASHSSPFEITRKAIARKWGNGAALQMRGVDVFDSYAAYRKAADLNRFNIMPLARMQRIVSGVINQFEEGTLKEEIVDQKPSAPSLYADDLIFDLEHMRAIDALLLEEISHRLRVYALDAETTVALDEMRRCIGSQFSTCPPESRVDAWMDIALGREQLQASQKVSLLLGKARLASYRGELDLAVELMEQALGLTASDISILIEIAILFGKHDDLDSADELLEKIAPLVEASGRRATDFRRLKEYLAEERAGARSQDAALGFHAIQTSVAP